MFTSRKREFIPSYPKRLPHIRRVFTSVVVLCLMSSTLALAESVDQVQQLEIQSDSATQITAPILAKGVLVDGLDSVPSVRPAPPVPSGSKCPQWFELAMQYFPLHEWDTIDFLLHRESRCDAEALNLKDTNGKPSYSLFQINAFWCSPNKHYVSGFLQEHKVLTTCEELFDPATQFMAARAIYEEGLVRHGVGWRSWGNYPETR